MEYWNLLRYYVIVRVPCLPKRFCTPPHPKTNPLFLKAGSPGGFKSWTCQASWVRTLVLLLAATTQLCVSLRLWSGDNRTQLLRLLCRLCDLCCVSQSYWVSGWRYDSVAGSKHHSLPNQHGHAPQRSSHYWKHPQVRLVFRPHNLLFWSWSQRETHHQKLSGIST